MQPAFRKGVNLQLVDVFVLMAAAPWKKWWVALQNAVTATDQEIDKLVYELYGLTVGEIKLVEGNA
jgi:hypothetical protein